MGFDLNSMNDISSVAGSMKDQFQTYLTGVNDKIQLESKADEF